MKLSAFAEQLRASGDELAAAVRHLEFSQHSVTELHLGKNPAEWSPEALEKVEAFTSRFARTVDLLIHRVLRSIDYYELQEPGSLLDVANRAAARGIVDSVDWLRVIKDARNRIAHDYTGDHLADLLDFCQQEVPELLLVCERTTERINNLL